MAHLTNNNKLLILEFIENNPNLSLEEKSSILNVSEGIIKGLINKGYILIPSKLNRKWKKKNTSKVKTTM